MFDLAYRVEVRSTDRQYRGFCHAKMGHPIDQEDYDSLVQQIISELPGPAEDDIDGHYNPDELYYFTPEGFRRFERTISSLQNKYHARLIKVPVDDITVVAIGRSGLQLIGTPKTKG